LSHRAAPQSLFDRRLLIVAGKGGVGKTTIACALGLIAAQLGKRVLIAEVDGVGRAASLLDIPPGSIGEARAVRAGLSVMSVEGSAALAEYLEIIVPVKRVLQAVLSSRIYQYFVAAAPGLKELMTVGKIWFEAERVDETTGKYRWDLVVLDAPATGHSLQYLGMPRAAHEVFRAGLVGRESQRLVDLLTDVRRTAVCLVTTAEEMPVNETLEMYERLRGDLEMPLGYLIVNRMHQATLDAKAVERLAKASMSVRDEHERLLVQEVVQRAHEEMGWTTINKKYLRQLAKAVDLPFAQVPFLFAEEFGAEQVHAIAAVLEDELVPALRRREKHGKA
jgi:anion-transporting  ArsA/GET3 family ATPase